jgi:glycosyltransferase involved in cell wall biosynthesis
VRNRINNNATRDWKPRFDVASMGTSPLVSVVIPAKNAAGTIGRAVQSVLVQDYRPIEIIVVDDASEDETAELAGSMDSAIVRIVRLPTSLGAGGARNVGIEAAKGEIVAFQDADDEWLAGKLSKQMALLLSDQRMSFVACGTRFISPSGQDLGPLYGGQIPKAGGEAWRDLLARNTIATPSVTAWRAKLQAEGGFDITLRVAEDQDMWIRLAMRGHLGYVDEPLIRVHSTPNSLSGVQSERSYQDQLRVTIPMVKRHVESKRGELSQPELRRILGERWGRLGRSAYSFGFYGDGLRMIVHASLLGFEPFANLAFLLKASPPMPWLKRQIRTWRR